MIGSPVRRLSLVVVAIASLASSAGADDYKLEKVAALPEGLPAEVAQVLLKEGHRVAGPNGPMIDLWFAKDVAGKKDFKPTLNVKYPYQPGQFIGVLRVNKETPFSDFRRQPIAPGLYTLRYGQQPQDGNHIGTSDFSDFLLALPITDDKSPKKLDSVDDLQSLSAAAAGTAHPAILQLLPAEEKPAAEPALKHDESREFWILQTQIGKPAVSVNLVVVGAGAE
jgi:hypothetical protein